LNESKIYPIVLFVQRHVSGTTVLISSIGFNADSSGNIGRNAHIVGAHPSQHGTYGTSTHASDKV
jgi:hypothetical protein